MVVHVLSTEIKVETGDGKTIQTVGSPTTTLYTHIIDALYSGSNLANLNKVVLVDSNNTERDYTTSLTISVATTLTVTATVNVTANYAVTKIRVYSGSNLYFEYSVNFSVTSGLRVAVTITVSLNLTGSLGQSSIVNDQFRTLLWNVLKGTYTASVLNVTHVTLNITNLDTNETYNIDVTASKERTSTTSLRVAGSYTPDYDWGLNTIGLKASANRLWYYAVALTGYAGVTINYECNISAGA